MNFEKSHKNNAIFSGSEYKCCMLQQKTSRDTLISGFHLAWFGLITNKSTEEKDVDLFS